MFVPAIVRKLNPSTVGSKWKIIFGCISKLYSSSAGYSPEELEQFRKVFRTVPSYEESISSKELSAFLQSINYIKSLETYRKYVEFWDKEFGGRVYLPLLMNYLRTQHDNHQLMNQFLISFDRDNDGYISKEEYELGMKTIMAHDPKIRNISYEKFLKEADANKDGKISVSECNDWLEKNLRSV